MRIYKVMDRQAMEREYKLTKANIRNTRARAISLLSDMIDHGETKAKRHELNALNRSLRMYKEKLEVLYNSY
jgi:hypothetical protein